MIMTMGKLVLCIQFSVLISTIFCSLCNLTAEIKSNYGNYYSLERNNSCYIFALTKTGLMNALHHCRTLGGYLTDVDSLTNNILQIYINDEKENYFVIDQEYWIGLLWNSELGYWHWANGDEVTLPKRSLQSLYRYLYPNKNSCNTLKHDLVKNVGIAGNQHAFICKLNIECIPEVTNETRCSERCRNYIRSHMNTAETISTTLSTVNNTDAINTTSIDAYKDDREKEDKECIQNSHKGEIENKITVIPVAILGGVAALLLIALVIACVIIFKYRRLLRGTEMSPRISLVDILSADRADTRAKRPSQQSGVSHPGSASELLYSNTIYTYSDPNGQYVQAERASDIIYHNHKANPSMSFASTNVNNSNVNGTMSNNEYSRLDRNGEVFDVPPSGAMYGIESASDLAGISTNKSPTYETYT